MIKYMHSFKVDSSSFAPSKVFLTVFAPSGCPHRFIFLSLLVKYFKLHFLFWVPELIPFSINPGKVFFNCEFPLLRTPSVMYFSSTPGTVFFNCVTSNHCRTCIQLNISII